MGLLRFLIISICILWIIRFIFRLVLPLLFKKLISKVQQQSGQQYYHQHHNHTTKKPEGSIRVEYVPPKEKEARAADKAGEFIDFEELK